jgi:DnaK suppressor protein
MPKGLETNWRRTHNNGKAGEDEPMNNSELQRLRRYLEIHREEAWRSLNRLEDETRSVDSGYPQDVADLCATSLSKESLFERSSARRRLLRMIEAALARIEQGTYGVCACCGDEINSRRLDALPWTQYCLRCQQVSERFGNKNLDDYRFNEPCAAPFGLHVEPSVMVLRPGETHE